MVITISRNIRLGCSRVNRDFRSNGGSMFNRGCLTNINGTLRGTITHRVNYGMHSVRLGMVRHYSSRLDSGHSVARTRHVKNTTISATLGNVSKYVVAFRHMSRYPCGIEVRCIRTSGITGRIGCFPGR